MERYRSGSAWHGYERMTYERAFVDLGGQLPAEGPVDDALSSLSAGEAEPMSRQGSGSQRGSILIKGKRVHLGDISPQELGEEGERIALGCLKRMGFVVLRRNWKCLAGEVDIVAQYEDVHALIEVKTRLVTDRNRNPWPELAVDARKQERYRVMAELYLQELDEPAPVRFDVIAINIVGEGVAKVRYYEGAFECDR